MQTIILPKNPRKKDYFIASMAYIAGGKDEEMNFTMESADNPSNIRDREVLEKIKQSFPDDMGRIITMYMNYNVCDPVICGEGSVIDKVRKISQALMSRVGISVS